MLGESVLVTVDVYPQREGKIVEGLKAERFLILPHPEVLTFFQRKADDYDRWLAGMRRLRPAVESPATEDRRPGGRDGRADQHRQR